VNEPGDVNPRRYRRETDEGPPASDHDRTRRVEMYVAMLREGHRIFEVDDAN
jgi:hypothetical protein